MTLDLLDPTGVLASLAGTHMLIEAQERALLRGYLVNKFRGDKSLFTPAVDIVARRTGMICHGVIPWFEGAAALPAEDAVALDRRPGRADGAMCIAVPRLSRIANFDDLDPLAAEADVAIASGHLRLEETRILQAEANKRGITKFLVTHANWALTRYDLSIQQELLDNGAYVEYVAISCVSPTFYEQNPIELAEWINANNGRKLILTSDLGQYSAAPHPEGLRMIIATLLDYGVSRDMLTLMTQVHPAELLNLSV